MDRLDLFDVASGKLYLNDWSWLLKTLVKRERE